MAAQSSATTVWEGDLAGGSGHATPESKAFDTVEVTWAARTERAAGKTSPEELLAAAHSSCYCMQLAHELAEAGNAPERLEASARVEFEPGPGVTGSRITVRGRVPGLDQDAFAEAARGAGERCPVSGALSIDIAVEATLEGG